jgi:hypothetical protein
VRAIGLEPAQEFPQEILSPLPVSQLFERQEIFPVKSPNVLVSVLKMRKIIGVGKVARVCPDG